MAAVRLHTMPPGRSRRDRRPLVLHGVSAGAVRAAYRARRLGRWPADARAATLASFAGLADRIEVA